MSEIAEQLSQEWARGATEPVRNPTSSGRVVAVLFTVTAFWGAGLLFVVQPMVARLVLPAFGGSATVWSTSSLFFQALLLSGYLYTHMTTRRLGSRVQPLAHLAVLAVPLLVLPISLPADVVPAVGTSPVAWLLRVLAVTIGLPFIVVSTTGPLLQRWYSWSGGPRADDPYFMFAASNLGSFGGLLIYPFVIEPGLTLGQQRSLWSWGYVAFGALTATCALTAWWFGRAARRGPTPEVPVALPALHGSEGLPRRAIGSWLVLAFLPSAMMLAVTAHVSTDIAAIPLLWVVPLAIYLATFVAAFSRARRVSRPSLVGIAIGLTLSALASSMLTSLVPVWLDLALNMAMLAAVSYCAHAQLAAQRPSVRFLTGYYLVVSLGGALGGLLNGVVAPLLFDRVLEYPIVAVLVPLILVATRPSGPEERTRGRTPAGRDAADRARRGARQVGHVLLLAAALGLAWFVTRGQLDGTTLTPPLLLSAAFVLGVRLARRRRDAVAAMCVLLVAGVGVSARGTVERSRTFFGAYRVVESGPQRWFMHGTTLHGMQFTDSRRGEPTTYYARGGPLADVLSPAGIHDVAVVGLGVGTVAAYGRPGQRMSFVEIDPEVARIARDSGLFRYLADSEADVRVVVGDGRLEVAKMPPASLDVVVLDAFSSDSIPVHLLTREAMALYASRLRAGGVLAIHVSNRVFDLRPVVRAAAQSLGRTAVIDTGPDVDGSGAKASEWTVIAEEQQARGFVDRGWGRIDATPVEWADDYSSILTVLR